MSDTGTRIRRYSLITAIGLFVLVVLLLTTISLAIYTEAGSRRVTMALIQRGNSVAGFELQSTGISGNLLSGLTLTNVSIAIPGASIKAASVRALWNPWSILSGSFYLSALNIDTLHVAIDSAPSTVDPISLLQLPPLPVDVAVGRLTVSDFTLSGIGPAQQFQQLSLSAQLQGSELHITDLHLQATPFVIDLNLQADLRNDIPLLASLNWEYQGALFADYTLATGSAALTGDLRNLSVQHELLAPEAIHSSGEIHAPLSGSERRLQFTHTTERLVLPYTAVADYIFDNVSLSSQWSGSELALELRTGISGAQIPATQLAARGILLNSRLQITDAQLTTATGALSADGQLNWSGPFTSAFKFNVTEQAPLQYLAAAIPIDLANVSANGNGDFRFADEQPHLTLVLDEFRGTTGEYEVTGQAALSVVDNALQIENLHLKTAANEIIVSGQYQQKIQLDWQLNAPVLGQVLAGISGSVSGSGRIEGALDNPSISAALQIHNLSNGTLSAAAIDVSVAGTRDQLRSEFRFDDIVLGTDAASPPISQLLLAIAGNLDSHSIEASLNSDYGDLNVALEGGIHDLSALEWEGSLNAASLRSEFGNWLKQGQSTPLLLSRDTINIGEMCWQLDAAGLCVKITQPGANELNLAAVLNNFPLHEFNSAVFNGSPLISYPAFPRLPEGIDLEGTVTANLNAAMAAGANSPQLDFSLIANQALLRISSVESVDEAIDDDQLVIADQRYQWDVFSINGALTDGMWNLSGNAELSQQNIAGTSLGLNGVLDSDLSIDTSGNLAGTASARFAELGWIQAFLPELSAISGSLSSDIVIGGSLNAPLFSGKMDLLNGSANLAPLGITLTDVHSAVTAQSSGNVQITGALNSAAGSISFTSDISDVYKESRSARATLSGNAFRLANIPDLLLDVSPELQLSANRELINLNGSLDIPTLNLILHELPESAVDISRDAVIINYPADHPELARSIAASQSTLFDIPVSAEINLTLGDNVTVSGFGMEATLDGNLAIQQRADGRNVTYGELGIVQGNYRLYGQTLTLRQGKLLFFGALDNPALDIRAVREVEGMTAGVLMNGTLKNIRSQLFSTPVLPDNDIIAVLITGRPASEMGAQDSTAVLGAIANLGLDRGQGLTNQIRDTLGLDTLAIDNTGNINSSILTIGKYLTPDIFVRYGVGLFDRQSKVAIDYSLSERIMLQAESGEYQSIDLTYTVER
jgi:translocation and assembly module TamB